MGHLALDSPSASTVVTKALLRAADRLGLAQRDLARVIGVSPATVSRLAHGRALDPDGKETELALLFLRVFRSLDSLLGGDAEKCRAWLHAENLHLEAVPAELLASITGLVRVADYLDAMRGR